MRSSVAVGVTDASGPAAARRAAAAVCSRLAFDTTDAGRASIVVTEIATNLLKHAGSGEVVITPMGAVPRATLQVVGLDKGPGFDVARCLPDGVSTAGGPGNGLGAMRRLSDAFDVYSRRGEGTVIVAEITGGGRSPAPAAGAWLGALAVPMPGEEACGDAWAMEARDGRISVLIVDGLGHGPSAEQAALAALVSFGRSAGQTPAARIQALHGALRPTRGAAAGVAEIDHDGGRVLFCGVGNTAASIHFLGRTQHLVSHNGTVGHEMRRVQEFESPWPPHGRLVMASDGISTRWDPASYPGILEGHPALLAGILYRDFRRTRDDASVVVVAEKRPDAEAP